MPGYAPDSLDVVQPWRRRRRYIAIGAVAFIYGFLYALLPPSLLGMLLSPLVVIFGLIIWALPLSDTAPGRAMRFLFWAFWISFMAWPNYLALEIPGLPWITVNRLFGGPLLFLLLYFASTSRPFRDRMIEILSSAGWIWKMVVALSIVGLFANFLSPYVYVSFNKYFNNQIVWTAIFFAAVWVFQKPGSITVWAKVFVLLAIGTSLIGIIEADRRQILWANSIPFFLKIEDPSVIRLLDGVYRFGQYRISATTMSPLTFAEFLALSTPFLLYFLMTSRNAFVWAALLAADALIFVAILNTDARLGMVGWFLAHGAMGFLFGWRAWRASKTSLLGPAVTLSYPALLIVFTGLIFSIGRLRVLVLGDGSGAASDNARAIQREMMWPVLAKSPLIGYGTATAANKLGYKGGGDVLTLDSYFITIALDYGVLGFLLFYGLVVGGIFFASRLALDKSNPESKIAIPIAVCLCSYLLIKMVLSQVANNTILFMILGALTALAWQIKNTTSQVISHDPPR